MTIRPWDAEETAWAFECYVAGDTFAEIAEAAGRTRDEVMALLKPTHGLTRRERMAAAMYSAGRSFKQIGLQVRASSAQPDELGRSFVIRAHEKRSAQRRPEAAHA